MASDRTRELVLPVAVLASVAVGALLGNMFTRAESGATTAAASPVDSKDLVDVLQALRAEIALLREAHTALSVPPSASERVEVSTGATAKRDLAQELHAATAQLSAAVETLRHVVERPGGDPGRLIFPTVPPDPKLMDALASREPGDIQREYLLWTQQQVVTEFGKPINVNDYGERGIEWDYVSDRVNLSLRFQNGCVVKVETHVN